MEPITVNEEKINHNKKIIKRFLKECGLYAAFVDYINEPFGRRKHCLFEKDSWGCNKYVDRILGQSDFTPYLEKTKQFKLICGVSQIFRAYCKTFKPKNCVFYDLNLFPMPDEKKHAINKNTHIIDINEFKK